MYFVITGRDEGDDGSCWMIVEAESKEDAQKKADEAGMICERVEEKSVEELIEKEKDELVEHVFHSYLMRNSDITIGEYNKAQEKLKKDPKEQYAAMRYFSCKAQFIYNVQTRSCFCNDLTFGETMRLIEQIAIAYMQKDYNAYYKAIGQLHRSK